MKKLAIIITHPIQYYVPLFQLLAKECKLRVFYTWGEKGAAAKYDPDFKQVISWDLPLLDGYNYEFLLNTAQDQGSHHFKGIINPTLKNRVKIFNPDAILVYGWAYQSHLLLLRYFSGKIPIWFRGDSTLIDEQKGLKKTLRIIFLKWVYRYIDKAFYVGTANKTYFKKFGLRESQLIFAPHAIDNKRFREDHKIEVETLRKKLNILPDEILILFAGKLEPKKDPEILLKAFLALNKANVHLLFVGNGVLEESLKAQSKLTTNQKAHIHFLNFQNQSQMPIIYQACDLFCLPSKGPGETWGLAVNEAMAAGKPILVSNKVGCALDLVKPLINGEIFESNDLSDLQTKLNYLLNNTELLRNMGDNSKKMIEDWTFLSQATTIIQALSTSNESH